MTDAECVAFLQWALPRLRLRWPGFRRVRGQVCKRVHRRLKELGLPDTAAYRSFLEEHSEEWDALDAACRITISRFYRDRAVFDYLGTTLLPGLAELASSRGETSLRCWSAGCGSGEEPYTLSVLWQLSTAPRYPHLKMRITATDVDSELLERARRGWYPSSSLRDVPREWTSLAFRASPQGYRIRERFRREVELVQQDVRKEQPSGRFHLVLCRNLVLTYFEESLQRELLTEILERLEEGGSLVIGSKETLAKPLTTSLEAWSQKLGVYRKRSAES